MDEYKMDMQTAVIFGVTDLISLIFNFYFHYLIYRMTLRKDLKKSQGTITNVLACYSVITPITFLFAFIYLNIILQYTSPPSEIIGEWFCFVYEYYVHVVCIYLATFSLFTALMKYWFIVENARATNFGVEKGRTVFLIIHLITPITIAALNSISNGERDLHYLVNICWSQSMSTHEIGNSSVLDDPGGMDMFCTNRHYQTTYYLGAAASHYMDPFLRMICGSISIFQAIFCSNLCELFVYALLYKYLNR